MQAINQIIERCLSGDQQSYATLYDEFADGLYRLCYSILLNQHDAEDVTQESFVYAFRNLARYDPQRASFKTWLYTIAVSRCRNLYRRKRPVVMDIAQMFQLKLPGPKSETPESALAARNAQHALETALVTLSPHLREAIVLRYGHGLMYREIAEVMNCPQKTAESRVRLAHDALRGLLQTDGPGLLEELVNT